MERLKEALREEIDKLEERFHVRKRKDNAGGRLEDRTMVETGEDPGGGLGDDREAEKASTYPMWTTR